MKKALLDITEALKAAGRIALILHLSPDGDTCGSALALGRTLLSMGKEVTVYCDDPVPRIYRHLSGADQILPPEEGPLPSYDLAVAIDVGDLGRMGRCRAIFEGARHTAQIDHHGTNPGYAEFNLVRSPLSATAVLMMEVLDALGASMDRETALCIYTAVVTDTGNLKQKNTDAAAMRLAARCVEMGLDPSAITRALFDVRPLSQGKLLGRALLSLAPHGDGTIAMMALSHRDFEETGALLEHTEGIVNFALNTEGVRLACLLYASGERIKCSLRSLPPYDASRVAVSFGGGGHTLAAGCILRGTLADAYDRVRDALILEWEARGKEAGQ